MGRVDIGWFYIARGWDCNGGETFSRESVPQTDSSGGKAVSVELPELEKIGEKWLTCQSLSEYWHSSEELRKKTGKGTFRNLVEY